MLGNIASKLRIFGYDTEFFLDATDDYIIEKGVSENRIILTRDKELYCRVVKKKLHGILVSSDNEHDDLVDILSKCGIDHIDLVPNINTRCTKCNGELVSTDKSLEKSEIPEKVYSNIQLIYKCNACSKIYWSGTHINSINLLLVDINKCLEKR